MGSLLQEATQKRIHGSSRYATFHKGVFTYAVFVIIGHRPDLYQLRIYVISLKNKNKQTHLATHLPPSSAGHPSVFRLHIFAKSAPYRLLRSPPIVRSTAHQNGSRESQNGTGLNFHCVMVIVVFREILSYLAVYIYRKTTITDRKSTRLNSSHKDTSRMPSSA